MNLRGKILGIIILIVATSAFVFPWNTIGVQLPEWLSKYDYKLGLDLHGGVELDYKVDFDAIKDRPNVNQKTVVEGLKSIIEKRVNSLGTAEPTLQEASYGNEEHIIVQVPTMTFDGQNLTKEEQAAQNQAYIQKAKDTIGKVVRLEFKEAKTDITESDKADRKKIADAALAEVKAGTFDFKTVATKYKDQNENVEFLAGTGTLENLPSEVKFDGIEKITDAYTTQNLVNTKKSGSYTMSADNKLQELPGDAGYTIVKINSVKVENKERDVLTGTGASAKTTKEKYTEKTLDYQAIFVSQKPSEWMTAKTEKGGILDERYLTKAGVSFTQVGSPQVELTFNDEGGKIFAELTKRMVGRQLAIFVGGQMLTAPTVNTVIPNGRAVITGNYTVDSATKLANDINTGIVPAPIYLTSERAIDAKIGGDSLNVIIIAGAIGFALILTFLIILYRVSGLLAGVALFAYTILTIAIIKMFGVVLTLSSIAGLILSIGLAIDANILIFERTKEELRKKESLAKAIQVGFDRSWSAIWDSHVTSFISAVILYVFGTNLIKGFGLMLGIGIIVSLFSAMYISKVFILALADKFAKNTHVFAGEANKK
jgi:protein-export membrane protein SecD